MACSRFPYILFPWDFPVKVTTSNTKKQFSPRRHQFSLSGTASAAADATCINELVLVFFNAYFGIILSKNRNDVHSSLSITPDIQSCAHSARSGIS